MQKPWNRLGTKGRARFVETTQHPPTPRPCVGGCEPRGKPSFWKGKQEQRHDWEWRHNWNGNSRDILPWEDIGTRGIGRSGWRCYCCGAILWDQSDEAFMVQTARAALGIDIQALITKELEHRHATAE